MAPGGTWASAGLADIMNEPTAPATRKGERPPFMASLGDQQIAQRIGARQRLEAVDQLDQALAGVRREAGVTPAAAEFVQVLLGRQRVGRAADHRCDVD